MRYIIVLCAFLAAAGVVASAFETAMAAGNAESCQNPNNRNLARCRGR